MSNRTTQSNKDEIDIAVIASRLSGIEKKIDEISDKLDADYLTRREFEAKFGPIQKLVFGFVAVALTAVVGAILALVIKK